VQYEPLQGKINTVRVKNDLNPTRAGMYLGGMMLSKKGGRFFKLAVFVCVGGCAGFLYIGHYFFKDRSTAFVLFNAYIILLTILVIWMIYRYIKGYISD